MFLFSNGTIAVTELGAGSSLPESVKIISQSGEVLFANEPIIKTSGIHGSAGNDELAIFGSNTGILVVADNGEQSLINYPDSFDDDVWFGSLLATSDANLFIGYTSTKGAYFVNIEEKEIAPVYESDNLFKCITSKEGDFVAVLTKAGGFNVTDVATGQVKYQGQLSISIDTESTGHGSVVSNIDVSEEFLYVSIPSNKKIVQIELSTLKVIEEFVLDVTPYQFKVLGHEFDH